MALNSLMLIMAVVELIVSIWSAVLGCRAVCRCCKSHSAVVTVQAPPGQLPYPQQQIIMYPGFAPGQQFTVHGQQTACKCLRNLVKKRSEFQCARNRLGSNLLQPCSAFLLIS